MKKITRKDILDAHSSVQKETSARVVEGVLSDGNIELVVERPFLNVYGVEKYDTIYKKAACYVEGIVRLHPFADGNKRTAAVTLMRFLYRNKHFFAIPPDMSRFLVEVAKNQGTGGEEVDSLIDEIASWIESRTATNSAEFVEKKRKYRHEPLSKLRRLMESPDGKRKVRKTLEYWLVTELYPEKMEDVDVIVKLIEEIEKIGMQE